MFSQLRQHRSKNFEPVAIVKKRLNLQRSLHSMLQILSVSLFEKIPILQALSQPEYDEINYEYHNQLILSD
jgi:hypothetical protein